MQYGKILILDDEESFLRTLGDYLKSENYDVELSSDVRACLNVAHDERYALIVLDYKMPVMNGIEFLAQLRKISPKLPVIMVSGYMNTPELIQAANLGVSVVLEKPFDTKVFLGHIRRYVLPIPQATRVPFNPGAASRPPIKIQAEARDEFGDFTVSYQRAEQVSEHSRSNQFFLQRLWDSVRESRRGFIFAPAGAELELVQREVSRWKSRGDKRLYAFSAAQIKAPQTHDILGFIPSDPESSTVVLIHSIEEASSDAHDQLATLLEDNASGRYKNLVFLFHLKDAAFLADSNTAGIGSHAFFKTARERLCRLRPLHRRLSDLAFYARRHLAQFAEAEGRPGKARLSQDAMFLLLFHPWPGEFSELQQVLRRAVLLGNDDSTASTDLLTAFARLQLEVPMPPRPSLEQNLHFVQDAYLGDLVRASEGNLAAALAAAGEDPSLAESAATAASLSLLAPDLVR